MVYHIGCFGWSTSGRSSVCTIQTRGAVNGLADGGGGYQGGGNHQNHFPQRFTPVIPVEVQRILPDILLNIAKGTTDPRVEFILARNLMGHITSSKTNLDQISLHNLDHALTSKFQPNNSISSQTNCREISEWVSQWVTRVANVDSLTSFFPT